MAYLDRPERFNLVLLVEHLGAQLESLLRILSPRVRPTQGRCPGRNVESPLDQEIEGSNPSSPANTARCRPRTRPATLRNMPS
jgi:hypothetical protein